MIPLVPDQPTAGLHQAQRRVGHRDIEERVAPLRFRPLRHRLIHRIIRHRKRQFGNDHMPTIVVRQIDALGKTGEPDQHALRTRIDRRSMRDQQRLFRAVALNLHPGQQIRRLPTDNVAQLAP